MADRRPIWRGQLRLALVSCPIALYATHHDRDNLHFHLINPKTGHRVRNVPRDAETGDEVTRSELVKGYEYRKDHYITMEDADFEAARTPSSSVIKVEKFIPQASLNPIHFDTSYYVAPDGEGGEDVYAVLREAIAESGMAALSRVVMTQRERVVILTVLGRGLVAHTLYEARDLNDPKPLFADLPDHASDPDMIKLARQLIDRQSGDYDPADFEDQYEKRLRSVIEAKVKGQPVEPDEPEARADNVVDLMAALKKSLGEPMQTKKPGKKVEKPTEKTSEKPAAKRKRN